MEESTVSAQTRRFSSRATLAALGLKLHNLDLFGPIRTTVAIPQKTVKHSPTQKLYDAFITLLAGAQGLVEINSRLRSDPAVRRLRPNQLCRAIGGEGDAGSLYRRQHYPTGAGRGNDPAPRWASRSA